MNIQCDNVIVERKPDFFISNKMEKTAIIMDAAITLDNRILTRKWKIEKNQNIRGEIQRLWNLWNLCRATSGLGGSWECYKEHCDIRR